MDSNYQWQKHQADERSQARLREAETHRLLKQNSPHRQFFLVRALKRVFKRSASLAQDRRGTAREEKRSHKPRLAK